MRLMILLLISSCFLLVLAIGYLLSAPPYTGPVSHNFNGKVFVNQNGAKAKGFRQALKWSMQRELGLWTDETRQEPPASPKPQSAVADSLVITYINHASFLIQADSINILTDPIYSDRASPFSFAGPRRMRWPGVRFQDLPAIDVVLISHNHYDHLDLPTIRRLHTQHQPQFIVPLGVGRFLQKKGIENVTEIDWWQMQQISGIDITGVPAQHFSARGLFDQNKTLWAGYVIHTRKGNVYFAGDTGYGDFFSEIGERFSIDVALLPIGAYKPGWMMSDIHLNPEEAVKAHKALKAKSSVAMHFGVFPMADDGQEEPIEELNKTLAKPEYKGTDFRVLPEGGHLIVH